MAIPTVESIQTGIQDLLKRIQTEGVTGTKGEVLLAPQKLQTTPTGQITPQISPIAADKLGAQENPIIIPSPTPKADTSSAFVTGIEEAQKQIAKTAELFTPPPTPEAEERKSILAKIKELIPGLGGKQEVQLAKETELGLPEQRKQLADIQGQVATKIAEYKKLEVQEQTALTAVEQVPGSRGSIAAGQQRELSKEYNLAKMARSAEIGILQAQGLAINGQIEAAQTTADRSIDLKYGAIEDEINIRLKQLELIEPELTKQEKIRADAIKLYLTQKQQDIDEQKSEQKQIQSVMLEAASNGAPSNTLSSISNSQTVLEATQKASNYLQKPISVPKGNLLTLNEAKSLGLPTSLVGMSEEEVGNQLDSNIVPLWFKQKTQEKAQTSLTPDALQRLWDKFRNSIKESPTTVKTSETKLDLLVNSL